MNKFVLSKAITLIACYFISLCAHAIVACPDPATITQPNGNELTIVLHGDEWFNFVTTSDGYTVMRDPVDGFYKYATLVADTLVPGSVVAHDSQRNAAERAHLAATPRYLTPSAQAIAARRAPHRLHGTNGRYDYKNFRGLVILVAFNDCPFQYTDAHTLFNDMINKQGYTGFMSNAMFPEMIPYTGSVRDYFYSSSAGEFDPQFDVVGPVTIDYSVFDALKTARGQELAMAALDAANGTINYDDYDRDNDGVVDMVFFLYAGPGSNFSGNDERLLWPHASSVMNKSLDGVRFGRYACSTELYGRPESKVIDGIGTMCHEFSHVLGVADLYDTDGASNGTSVTPSRWSLMAQGSYLNQSRTPCAYSVYERYAAGFTTPITLTNRGNYNLKPMPQFKHGYRLDTTVPTEFFLLETRVREGWDAYLPGEGMLVWRVDSTNVDAWENNKVNCNAAHNNLVLMRANNGTGNSADDPFPGTAGITSLDNTTTPNLCSWVGMQSSYGLSNITLNADHSVSFDLAVQHFENKVEDFEAMKLTTANANDVPGHYTQWTLTGGARVAATGSDNAGNGNKACSMIRSSELISAALPWEVQSMSFDFYNPTVSNTIVRTYYRTSGTATWTSLANDEGMTSVTVAAGSRLTINFTSILPQGSMIRIVEYTGNRTNPCYVDDITCVVAGEPPVVVGDVNNDGTVDVADVNAMINYLLTGGEMPQDLNGDNSVDIADVNVLLNIILQL